MSFPNIKIKKLSKPQQFNGYLDQAQAFKNQIIFYYMTLNQ